MYVIVHGERVISGPMEWNRAMFDHSLTSVGVNFSLPRLAFPDEELPFVIDENTKIMRAELVTPEHNEKIESTHGPYWDFSTGIAVGTYGIKTKDLGPIREYIKTRIAAIRYDKETSGKNITINGSEVFINTNRDARNVYAQRYLAMADSDTVNWKFGETWLTLSKADINTIIIECQNHVQSAFDWEKSKCDLIDAANTPEDLDAITFE